MACPPQQMRSARRRLGPFHLLEASRMHRGSELEDIETISPGRIAIDRRLIFGLHLLNDLIVECPG